jgi:tetratricopeptide (TPR) repeat protein
MGDPEGRAEVLYHRGAVLSNIGKHTEAEGYLQKALDLSRTSSNEYQQIKAMLRLSTVLHTLGKTEPAKQTALDAVQLAENAGIENLATQGLIDLGDVYLNRREYAESEQVLKQALDFSRRNKGRRNEALARLKLAKLLIQQETRTDEALGHIEQSLQYFQQGGYSKEVSLAILLRGRACLFKADYQNAIKDFEGQLQFTQQTNNLTQLASTYLLLGNAYKGLEIYPTALINFQKSYEIYETLNNPTTMGYLLVYQGEMLARMGNANAARAVLEQLPTVVQRLDSRFQQTILARSAVTESQIALSDGRFAEAKEKAARALTLAGPEISHTASEARLWLGLAQLRSGATSEGLKTIKAAVESANQVHDEHFLSFTMLGQAEALLANGDPANALQIARDVQQRFTRSSQHESEWQAWLLIAHASAKQNDSAGARDAARRANEVLGTLEQKWGAEAFSGYAERADVKGWRKQLDELASQ